MKRVDAREIRTERMKSRLLVVATKSCDCPPRYATTGHWAYAALALDNGSTDGTLDYLCGEPDVHVFSTNSSYAESNYGVAWTNELLNAFGNGHWTLTIDADEQFIFPHYRGSHFRNSAVFSIPLEQRLSRASCSTCIRV